MDVVEVLFPSLLNIRMSSKYTTTNELVNGHKMSSISLMKVAGAFVIPKGMTNHSKRPSLVLAPVLNKSNIRSWGGIRLCCLNTLV